MVKKKPLSRQIHKMVSHAGFGKDPVNFWYNDFSIDLAVLRGLPTPFGRILLPWLQEILQNLLLNPDEGYNLPFMEGSIAPAGRRAFIVYWSQLYWLYKNRDKSAGFLGNQI
jgi:hypothetical protein